MSVLFEEMTREEIREVAPGAVAVMPTAATEQHGPHMAVGTDTLLVTTVAKRAAESAAGDVPVVITPALAFGSSWHHYPFGGTLSLTSATFASVVVEVLGGLVRAGFRHLVVLNGHGGNKDLIGMANQDLVNRLEQPATVASCNYWDIAMPALKAADLMPANRIPGHAGQYETSAILSLRPDWVDEDARQNVQDMAGKDSGLDVGLTGATVQTYGAWGKGPGHTDNPAAASADVGGKMVDIIVAEVARFFRDFAKVPGPSVD
jgi:creatinine amidohydrolase